MARQVLLVCGIVSSVLYVATDVFGATRYKGYSYVSQTISELSAIGAPSRPLVLLPFIVYGMLVAAFGVGVWQSVSQRRPVRIVAGLLIAYGIICLTGPFTPMHQRAVLAAGGATLMDSLHKFGAMVDVLFILLTIGYAAAALGSRFRLYSIATILVVLLCGALARTYVSRIEANLPTPGAGVMERVSVFSALLWMAVLAGVLLRNGDSAEVA